MMRFHKNHVVAACSSLVVAVSCAGSGYTDMAATLSPVSFWRLTEPNGTTAIDNEGVSDGTYVNGFTLCVAGHSDESWTARFNGSNSYVSIPHDDAYLLDAGAVSMWFNADVQKSRQELFSKDSTNYDTGGHLTIMLKDSHAEVRIQSTTTSYWVSSADFDITEWNHILVAFGPSGLKLYINGELEDSDSYTGGLGATSGGIGNYEPIVIGANAWTSDDLSATPLINYFDGRIDEIILLDFQPNDSQVANLASPTGDAGDGTIRIVEWQTSPPIGSN